ncbi:hypothetical protein GCM10028809_59240 [Spirosoma gilvum]
MIELDSASAIHCDSGPFIQSLNHSIIKICRKGRDYGRNGQGNLYCIARIGLIWAYRQLETGCFVG